jgi:multisubunit Na+/H+ antiporter MnhC subunit
MLNILLLLFTNIIAYASVNISDAIVFSDRNDKFYVIDTNCKLLMSAKPKVDGSDIVISNSYFESRSYYDQNHSQNYSSLIINTTVADDILISTFTVVLNDTAGKKYIELNIRNNSNNVLLGLTGQMETSTDYKNPILAPNHTTFIRENETNINIWSIQDFADKWKDFVKKCKHNVPFDKSQKMSNQYLVKQLVSGKISSEIIYSTVINISFEFEEPTNTNGALDILFGVLFALLLLLMCGCFVRQINKKNRFKI